MRLKRQLLMVLCTVCTWAAFAQPASAAPPTIEFQWVTDVSSSNATLNAKIDPNGLLTVYKLQIDTTGNFRFYQTDGCVLHPPTVGCTQAIEEGDPLPAGLVEPPEMTLPDSTGSQMVKVSLSSIGAVLQPETTYHFRAIAANGLPFVYGPDLTFTTPAAGAPPFSEPGPPSNAQEPPEEEPRPGSEGSNPLSLPDTGSDSNGSAAPWFSSLPISRAAPKSATRKKKHRRRVNAAVHQARPIG